MNFHETRFSAAISFGSSSAEVTLDRIQMDLSAEIGILDWLTVGANVPLIKSRTEAFFKLRADSSGLGSNPAIGNAPQVVTFLEDTFRILRLGTDKSIAT